MAREIVDANASSLPATYTPGTINISAASSTPVVSSISPAVPLPSTTDQSITVNGSGFQAGLTVTVTFPNGGQALLSGIQIQNVTPTSFVMLATLNGTGTWSIRVNNPDGWQSNTFNFHVGSACIVTAITAGQAISGVLSTSDCTSPARTDGPHYADRYSFTGTAGQPIAILLTSSAYDTYIYLIGPTGSVITSDDDGGGGTNSRIPPDTGFFTLPSTGTYLIEATSFDPNITGNYTLSFLETAATIPSAPQNLAAFGGNGQNSLSWGAPSSNGGAAITSYRVFRGTNSSNRLIVTSGGCANLGAVLSCTDTGLTNGQSYNYIVSAFNSVGQGASSNSATATPTSALSITTIAFDPPTATVGIGYAAQAAMAATGGTTPYNWSASGLPNGMAINASTGAPFGTPTVAGTFNVTITVQDSSGPQQTASKVLAITVCSYAIQPTNQSFNASGGSGNVNVTAGSGCGWTATSNASWITVTSGTSGSGNGTVNYSVAANTSSSQRSGTLTAAGQTFNITQAAGNTLTIASAASYRVGELAIDSQALCLGAALATTARQAETLPLPTSLAGTTVRIRDSAGTERLAPLFGVSPTKVLYQVEAGTALGLATITVTSGDGTTSLGTTQIVTLAPGLFTANGSQKPFTTNASGQGVAFAVGLRVSESGTQTFEQVVRFDEGLNTHVAVPIEFGPPTERFFLILYATGIRNASVGSVTCQIGGVNVGPPSYVGPSSGIPGLDQLNLELPRSLAGRGVVDIVLTADGKTSNTVQLSFASTNNPVSTLISLSPNSATQGSAAFTLTLNGTNFISGSIVRWNGNDRATTFISSSQLQASIPASDIASTGSATVTVFNPAPGGGTSNAVSFTINQAPNPVPTITSLNPSSAVASSAAFTLSITGGSFISGSIVRWNGNNRTTSFISSTQLTAQIPASDIANAGSAQITVFNPAPGGGASNVVAFTINQANNPMPMLTGASPGAATAGGAAFTITVTGTNFVSGSVVRWNGANRSTTFVSSTQLNAQISAADIANPGTAQVTVFNPAPGGGSSGVLTFPINCNYTLLPSQQSFAASGGTGSVNVTTASGCNWTAVSNDGWVVITGGGSGNGNGTVNYSVAAHTGTNPRSGTLTIAGRTFTVNQSGATPNPAPTLGSLNPSAVTAGSGALTLRVNGTNFINSSVVQWNGNARPTTIVSNTQLTAQIPASDLAAAGTASVTVFNPAPGGGTSNNLTFTVNPNVNPVPTLTSLNPSSATAGGAAFTLTVNGTDFVSGASVIWNGNARSTTFVSSTQVTAQIPAGELACGGSPGVTVFNPAPGGGNSNRLTFTINNPAPTLASLSPNTALAGGAAFTLTINGANFVACSVVRWNGSERPMTFVSSTQLTAQIPASDLANTGTAQVTVFNPPFGGGLSNALLFTITRSGFTISGQTIYAISQKALPNVVVTAETPGNGVKVSAPPSDSEGQYAIEGLAGGVYLLTPAKTGQVNGITAYDAALIARHDARVQLLTGPAQQAADIDGNREVTSADALQALRLVIGSVGSGQAGNWRAFNLPPPLAITGNLPRQDLQMLLLGEVTGNWTADAVPAIAALAPVNLSRRNEADGTRVDARGVAIWGEGFAPGMTLVLNLPGGAEISLAGTRLQNVTATSCTALFALDVPGIWALRLSHPDGRRSETVVVKVP